MKSLALSPRRIVPWPVTSSFGLEVKEQGLLGYNRQIYRSRLVQPLASLFVWSCLSFSVGRTSMLGSSFCIYPVITRSPAFNPVTAIPFSP